jgi:hypothetical protein
VAPPSVLTCHCVAVPVPDAVKLADEPAQIITLEGLVLTTGGGLIVNNALAEVAAVPHVPEAITRYLLPFIEAAAAVMLSVLVVVPV